MLWRQTRRRRHGPTRDDARRPACAPTGDAGPRAVEPLESRRLLSGSAFAVTATTATSAEICHLTPAVSATAAVTATDIQGYTPAQIAHAYGFDQISLRGGAVADGRGQTIAIVNAYHHPNIVSDLATFDRQFGLADPPSFKIVDQAGGANLPRADAAWAAETALDVEWAHAMAPGANLLLVEARSDTRDDLLAAVDYARHAAGVSVVSMSWGTREFVGESSFDHYFTTPAGHTGVTFVAATGDAGPAAGPYWPAVSGNVLSIGGTTLALSDVAGTYSTEAAWVGSGRGASQYEALPAYQVGIAAGPPAGTLSPMAVVATSGHVHVVQQGTGGAPQAAATDGSELAGRSGRAAGGAALAGGRLIPDVAYNADPRTGFAVYNSFTSARPGGHGRHRSGGSGGLRSGGWTVVGGTSAGAPQWSALITIANQGRGLNGLPALDGAAAGGTIAALYAAYGSAGGGFNDVVGGGAGAGYDASTGLGSPKAGLVVFALRGAAPGGHVLQPSVEYQPPPPGAPPPPVGGSDPLTPATIGQQGGSGQETGGTGTQAGVSHGSTNNGTNNNGTTNFGLGKAAAGTLGWSRAASTAAGVNGSDGPSASAAARALSAAAAAGAPSAARGSDAGPAPSRAGGVDAGGLVVGVAAPVAVLFADGQVITGGGPAGNGSPETLATAAATLPGVAVGLAARAGDWLSTVAAALSAVPTPDVAAEGSEAGGFWLPRGPEGMLLDLGSLAPQAADPAVGRVWKVTAAVSLAAMVVGYGYCRIEEQRRREDDDRRRRVGRGLILAVGGDRDE